MNPATFARNYCSATITGSPDGSGGCYLTVSCRLTDRETGELKTFRKTVDLQPILQIVQQRLAMMGDVQVSGIGDTIRRIFGAVKKTATDAASMELFKDVAPFLALANPQLAIPMNLALQANSTVEKAKSGDPVALEKLKALKALADGGDPTAKATVDTALVLSKAQDAKKEKIAANESFWKRGLSLSVGHIPIEYVGPYYEEVSEESDGAPSVGWNPFSSLTKRLRKEHVPRLPPRVVHRGSAGNYPSRGRSRGTVRDGQWRQNPRGPQTQPVPPPGTGVPTDPFAPPPGTSVPPPGQWQYPPTGYPYPPPGQFPYPVAPPMYPSYPTSPVYPSYPTPPIGDPSGYMDPYAMNPFMNPFMNQYNPFDPYGLGLQGLQLGPSGFQTYDPVTDRFYSNNMPQEYSKELDAFVPAGSYNPYSTLM